MNKGKVYVGNIGVVILLNCELDITGATSTKIKAKKPDGTDVEWDAEVYKSKYLKYVTESGDLDQAGMWIFQASLTLQSGWTGLGEDAIVEIFDAFT